MMTIGIKLHSKKLFPKRVRRRMVDFSIKNTEKRRKYIRNENLPLKGDKVANSRLRITQVSAKFIASWSLYGL